MKPPVGDPVMLEHGTQRRKDRWSIGTTSAIRTSTTSAIRITSAVVHRRPSLVQRIRDAPNA
jgi:hypothetical protein